MATAVYASAQESLFPAAAAAAALPGFATAEGRAAYRAITAEANRLGWPQAYRADLLTHDRSILSAAEAPRDFLWSVRPTGTHLVPLSSWPSIAWGAAAVRCGPAEERWYHWRSEGLQSIDRGRFGAVVMDSWRNERRLAADVVPGQAIRATDLVLVRERTMGNDCVRLAGEILHLGKDRRDYRPWSADLPARQGVDVLVYAGR